jgi:hypothetical protein
MCRHIYSNSTKLHIHSSNGSIFITIKPKAKENFTLAIILLNILQKITLKKFHIFKDPLAYIIPGPKLSGPCVTPTSQVHISLMLLLVVKK